MEHKEYTCFLCGKKGIDLTTRQNQMFCSRNCRQKYYYRMGMGGNIRKHKPRSPYSCVHNQEIICKIHNCSTCGWNPEVAQKRKEAFAYG